MGKLKIKKTKERKLVWMKFRHYIDFLILICCTIIAFNIHPSNNMGNENIPSNKKTMIYIFHDYEWNEYVMNDNIHGSYSSWDYLFEDEVPNSLKWDEEEFTNSVSLGDLIDSQEWESFTEEDIDNDVLVKDNQVSLNEIISELWYEYQNTVESEWNSTKTNNSDPLVISIWDGGSYNENSYIVKENSLSNEDSSLIIERVNSDNVSSIGEWNNDVEVLNSESLNSWSKTNKLETDADNDDSLIAKSFSSIEKDRILPILLSRNDLFYNNETPSNIDISVSEWDVYSNNQAYSTSGITIIDSYADCMTPWWYKIHHWDSVLAYKQMDNAPDICNIERRFCWKWKLSWTYTQQWCSINKNYTYEQWGYSNTSQQNNSSFKWETRQNNDWSVTVKNNEIWWTFVFDRPNNVYTDFNKTDNIRSEEPWIEQTSRQYPDCTAPRWEKVKHWQFVQAFKHANWFSDAPCEAQIRLCSMWELMWTYTEPTCKTRDTSFIDRINGSPTRDTYSKEKIERVKKQIKNEKIYYEDSRKDAARSTNSEALDRILYILDQD